MTTSPEDAESSFVLIERAQAGDESALERLLERYRPRLQRWATGRLPRYAREVAETDDLVQDVLVGTFRNLGEFEFRQEWALQAYLRRAVTNRVRQEFRRLDGRPRREALDEEMPSPALTPLESAMGAETFARYDAALERLSDVDREAVIARLELGCSYQEVADLLEKASADAARMTVARALTRVAEFMADASLRSP
jgi:RNA polymerase sigma-70 factor (ECF subfamily)